MKVMESRTNNAVIVQAYADESTSSTTDDYRTLYTSLGNQYQPQKLFLGAQMMHKHIWKRLAAHSHRPLMGLS